MTITTRNAYLRWTGDGMVYEGRTGDSQPIHLDGDSTAGPSPMEALLMSLGGCMGIDIQAILEKGRIPIEALEVSMEGDRAGSLPKRFTAVRMTVRIQGPEEGDLPKVERAVQLSRDKYCSVFHSLQSDLDVDIQVELA